MSIEATIYNQGFDAGRAGSVLPEIAVPGYLDRVRRFGRSEGIQLRQALAELTPDLGFENPVAGPCARCELAEACSHFHMACPDYHWYSDHKGQNPDSKRPSKRLFGVGR